MHFLSPIFGGAFTIHFFKHELHLPRLKYLIVSFMVIALISYLTYLSTQKMIWYVVGDLIGMSLFLLNWILGVCNSFKSVISRFYTIAYCLLLFFGFDFFISTALGFPNAGVTTGLLKVGAFFEMLILSYAVVYRMHAIKQENDKIRNELYRYTQEIKKLKESNNSNAESYRLTPRQVKILGLITNGFSNKEIADELKISINTVKYHIKIIYDELNVTSRKGIANLKLNVN